ncbi:hypothetical protein L2E82_26966 [Cichorium intybus]|uniref:Uncharacterized protein n=1 Tax=Cichorium intybus TaxID=13427 RepID=A0ACB9CRU1_CICIN|nr:hypothetical protein L2E82_26966 [Cichorium intybus]
MEYTYAPVLQFYCEQSVRNNRQSPTAICFNSFFTVFSHILLDRQGIPHLVESEGDDDGDIDAENNDIGFPVSLKKS